ncbi:hypothetical protein [Turicibacter sanguinis]|uniref:hypothetical protein n=1 Tax=Turicibacter sanguinis TaxID=154288 RepID=UPI0018A925DF|nr:hypothetical protein [Turicibacter sanguinis]MDB8551638.1 hypothetical protein [Turicibacter sanguinis]
MLRLQKENEILKKAMTIFARKKVSQSNLCQFINRHRSERHIKQLCDVLNIPRSTYCQLKHQTESK